MLGQPSLSVVWTSRMTHLLFFSNRTLKFLPFFSMHCKLCRSWFLFCPTGHRGNKNNINLAFEPSQQLHTKLPLSTIKSKTHTCCQWTKAKCDRFIGWHASIQFNLKLIETCVLETHGQITKDNEIRRDLIELYRAMKKPTMASALHLPPEWRQVIGKDMAHRYN